MTRIEISEQAFNTLLHWASVGRTIDAAVNELLERDTEQAQYTIGELLELKQALDEVGNRCKETRAATWLKEHKSCKLP